MPEILMNRLLLLAFVLLASAFLALGANQARVSLHCLSLRVQQGTAEQQGLGFTLDISAALAEGEMNGELEPQLAPGAVFSHGAYYIMNGDVIFEPIMGWIEMDAPPAADANSNGVADFFEVSQPVSNAQTDGAYDDGASSGPARVTWSRAAGSATGTCQIHFPDLGLAFLHEFSIIEYQGALEYSLNGLRAQTSFALTNLADATRTLLGPIVYQIESTNLLRGVSGGFTNELGEELELYNSFPAREGNIYLGVYEMLDGDLSTIDTDYDYWFLRIEDPNDKDGNGIPGLSDVNDDTSPAPAPRLSLRPANAKLELSIEGQAGKVYAIQIASALGGAWADHLTITLTNATHVLELPLPATSQSYWRARAD